MNNTNLPSVKVVACEGLWYVPNLEREWTDIPVNDLSKTVKELVDENLELPNADDYNVLYEDEDVDVTNPELQIEFGFAVSGYLGTVWMCFDESATWWTGDAAGPIPTEILAEAAENIGALNATSLDIVNWTLKDVVAKGMQIILLAHGEVQKTREQSVKTSRENA